MVPNQSAKFKKKKQKQPFDSLSTSSEQKRPNDANQSPSASITTITK